MKWAFIRYAVLVAILGPLVLWAVDRRQVLGYGTLGDVAIEPNELAPGDAYYILLKGASWYRLCPSRLQSTITDSGGHKINRAYDISVPSDLTGKYVKDSSGTTTFINYPLNKRRLEQLPPRLFDAEGKCLTMCPGPATWTATAVSGCPPLGMMWPIHELVPGPVRFTIR